MAGVVLAMLVGSAAVAAQDPYRPQQWNLDRVGAPDGWSVARGDQQVVAIIDSGVDLEHPDLVDRFVRRADGRVLGRDVVEDDDVPQDPLGHGTMVAGVAAATAANGQGVAGVAPRARLLPVRVLDRDGRGTSSDVDEGIRWAVDHGATVINLSLESATSGDGDSLLGGATVAAPVAAVDYAWQHGVVVVAAAGNSGNGFTDYPRSSPIVLVGATDRDDDRTTFSDSGRDDLLMAPGVDIVSTWCRQAGDARCVPGTHTYGIADGTSFAAPHVAGALAVLRSAGLDADEAVRRLRDTARDLDEPGPDDRTGRGLLDLAAAVEGLQPPPTPPVPSPSASPTATPSAPDGTAAGTDVPSPAPSVSVAPATPTPEPTGATTDPSPPATEGEVTTPDADTAPVAAPDAGTPAGRPAWVGIALVLVGVAGASVAHEWARQR